MSVTLGQRVRAPRLKSGLTLRDVAERAGIDFTYLSKIENGHEVTVSEDTLYRLADVLQISDRDSLVFASGKIPKWFRDKLLNMDPDGAATLIRAWRIEMPAVAD